jgi:DNA (cytosine-5)-methyltransferase 1
MKKSFTFIDICAGVGGFRQAFDNVGGKCLTTCEIDKFCKATYLANFSENRWESDVTKIVPTSLPQFDVLCAGFPCQAFSLGGKQEGFNDSKGRGTIFFNIADIIEEKRPAIIFFENVKNLLTHDNNKTFQVIQKKLNDLNYFHHYFIINSQHFVPQRRERIYILCANKDIYSESVFHQYVEVIKKKYLDIKTQPLPKIIDILESDVDSKYTLSDKLWSFLQHHSQKHNIKGNGFGFGLIDPYKDINTRTLTARYYKDGSEILISQIDQNPRKLTPRECARIMGFPESFKQVSSNTQSYKQMGNSVVVPVVYMFAQVIQNMLNEN